jgi:chemotaxis signal transduction protein
MNGGNRKFLIFSLNESLYALELGQVAEVDDPPQMWPIPRAPSYYAGVLSFHGDIVAALRLSLFLGLSECRQAGKIVVLRQELASLAFLVDAIIRIVAENEVSFSEQKTGFSVSTLTFCACTAIQLDLEKIIFQAESDMHGG